MKPTDIDLAAHALSEAKRAEATARQARIEAEEALIALVGLKEEGTTSMQTDWYKVSTVGKLTRTLKATADTPPDLLEAITRTKRELDVTKLKRLATEDPVRYQAACKWITTKPAKPSAKVELIEQQETAA